VSLQFGNPDAPPTVGRDVLLVGPYSNFMTRMAVRHPGRWIVMEQRRVAERGEERNRTHRRMSARAQNVKRYAERNGVYLDVATRVSGTCVTMYVRGDDA
jgi:hypothetical protein